MFDTLIRHGFLTNQNARRVLSTLYLLIIYMICSFKEILQNTGTSIGTIAMATASLSTADLTTKVESCLLNKLTRQALLTVTFNIIRDLKKKKITQCSITSRSDLTTWKYSVDLKKVKGIF